MIKIDTSRLVRILKFNFDDLLRLEEEGESIVLMNVWLKKLEIVMAKPV